MSPHLESSFLLRGNMCHITMHAFLCIVHKLDRMIPKFGTGKSRSVTLFEAAWNKVS